MTADECIPNIGEGGRQQRMRFGIVALIVGVGLAIGLVVTDAERLWRLTVFLPLLMAGTGIFQARAKT